MRRKPLPIPERRLIDADDAMLSVMAKALEPDCSRRFGTAGEFLSALRRPSRQGQIRMMSRTGRMLLRR